MFDCGAVVADPALLAQIPTGPELTAALTAIRAAKATSPSMMDHAATVDVYVAARRHLAHAQALAWETTADLAGWSATGFDADEAAFAGNLSRTYAHSEVAVGRYLLDRLPAVFTALFDGRIDRGRAQVFHDLLTDVKDDNLARSLADDYLPRAEDWTAPQLRRNLRRAILKADPGAARERYERSVQQRRVELTADPNTTATLSGFYLPPKEAAEAFENVDAIARGMKNGGDERTLDQLRSDVYLGLLSGTLQTSAQPVSRQGVVELLVPLSTLTGQSDDPGTLAGYGPVIADIARQVAHQAAAHGGRYQWRYSVYDDTDGADGAVGTAGALLHNGITRPMPCPPMQADETARFPSAALRRWISARDRRCRAPGCSAPAHVCDVDHTIDHAQGGRTRHDNLGDLCRHHHRLKSEGGFGLEQPTPGTFVWTSPSRKTYTTEPDPPW